MAVRHAEKRRTATCSFANRVARISVDHYRHHVPRSYQEAQEHTCIATIVLSCDDDDALQVIAMGVGTKFLTENILCQEVSLSRNKGEEAERYGRRVRDCHAEVLARRAFRRYLSEEIRRCARQRANEDDSNDIISSILQHVDAGQSDFPRFRLRRGVHVHFYCSSAPCGNSVLKKFATMKKEVFFDDIGENEWPRGPHAAMPGHSIPMGQFALLVKKDNSVPEDTDKAQLRHLANNFYESHRKLTPKSAEWSMNTSVDWCPAGTTTVWSGRGSIHSCRYAAMFYDLPDLYIYCLL